jgi:hypothetical protein
LIRRRSFKDLYINLVTERSINLNYRTLREI